MKTSEKKAREFASSLRYSKEGLVPVVAMDAGTNELLMLAYANSEAVEKTLSTGLAWFYSRERKRLWKKGESSKNTMQVASVALDCDSDAIAYYVKVQGEGNACHMEEKLLYEGFRKRKWGVFPIGIGCANRKQD